MSMICFCVPKVRQILKETALNDKHNIKVMSRLHQGHLKVKLAENVHFLSISTLLLYNHLLQGTGFDISFVLCIFHTHLGY